MLDATDEINYAAHGGRLQAAEPTGAGRQRPRRRLLPPPHARTRCRLGPGPRPGRWHLWNRRWDKLTSTSAPTGRRLVDRGPSVRSSARAGAAHEPTAKPTSTSSSPASPKHAGGRTDLLIRACRERRIERSRADRAAACSPHGRAGRPIQFEDRDPRQQRRKKRTARLKSAVVGAPSGPARWCVGSSWSRSASWRCARWPRRCPRAGADPQVPSERFGRDPLRCAAPVSLWQIEIASSARGLTWRRGRGWALKKLVVLSLQVALVSLQLVTERDGAAGVPASLVFSPSAVVLLRVLQSQGG